MRLASLAIAAVFFAFACATGKGGGAVSVEDHALPKATPLDTPPAAVHLPDAPGLNVEDLSARLRDAVARTSGLDVVDELSVRSELAHCEEAPCPDVVASKYRDAAYIVVSSVSRIGDTFLTTVHVQRGAEEIVRVTAQGADARVSIETAGHEAGVALRKKLMAEGVGAKAAAGNTPDHDDDEHDDGGAG